MKDLRKILDEIGYDYVQSYMVGQDPSTKAIRGYVIGASREQNTYTVWSTFDWTMAGPKDRKRGIDVQHGHYGMRSIAEAQQCVAK